MTRCIWQPRCPWKVAIAKREPRPRFATLWADRKDGCSMHQNGNAYRYVHVGYDGYDLYLYIYLCNHQCTVLCISNAVCINQELVRYTKQTIYTNRLAGNSTLQIGKVCKWPIFQWAPWGVRELIHPILMGWFAFHFSIPQKGKTRWIMSRIFVQFNLNISKQFQ